LMGKEKGALRRPFFYGSFRPKVEVL
jgi:hypothetical protein